MRRGNRSYPASPGELMDRANILARGLMPEAPGLDGRTMLRTWGEVVEAAGQVWRQLPARSDFAGGLDVMNQLEESARSLHRAISGGSRTELDPTMQEIGQLLTRAEGIIERSDLNTQQPRKWSRPQLQDAFAARVSLIHTVYLSAHAVSVSLGTTALAERLDERLRVHAVPAEELQQRMTAVEEVALSYLDGHYPGAYDRRHRTPVDNDRLGAAVSAWDVHTQRFLSRGPTTAGMVNVAHALSQTTSAARHVWGAAVEAGHVDVNRFQFELSPALETMAARWDETRSLWQALRHPGEGYEPKMYEAARELQSAVNEIAWDGTGPSTSEVIARRADLSVVVPVLHRFQATAAGISRAFEEASGTGQFSVNPRTANRLVLERTDPDTMSAAVPPKAVITGAAVPLPMELKARLRVLAGGAANASRSAMRAAMAVSDRDARPASRSPSKEAGDPPVLGRDREHRSVARAEPALDGPPR